MCGVTGFAFQGIVYWEKGAVLWVNVCRETGVEFHVIMCGETGVEM